MESKCRRGFTLVELMVVIVIIGILAGVVVARYVGHDYDARVTRVKHDFKQIEAQITIYKLHTGRYPEKIEDLVEQPADVSRWKGPYLDSLRDPWGRRYVLQDSAIGNYQYELVSYGRDGEEGGSDEDRDITNHDEDREDFVDEYGQ